MRTSKKAGGGSEGGLRALVVALCLALGGAACTESDHGPVTPEPIATESQAPGPPSPEAVDEPLSMSITAAPITGKAPLSVAFHAEVRAPESAGLPPVRWDFGDGAVAMGEEAAHTYPAPGTYRVVASVTDAGGASALAGATVIVGPRNAPPTVWLTVSPASGVAPLVVQLHAVATDADGPQVETTWDFGDGTHGVGSSATHTYASAGSYPVSATVTDLDGAKASASVTIEVAAPNAPPQVVLNAAPTWGKAPLAVSFSADATDPEGAPLTVTWAFGDGATGSGAAVKHTFAAPGTFATTVEVTDPLGAITSGSVTIEVGAPNEPPTVLMSAEPAAGKAPLLVAFEAKATDPDGGTAEVIWSFGDGATATGPTATHWYLEPGSYDVTATASDGDGSEGSAGLTILVGPANQAPILELAATPTSGPAPLTVGFEAIAVDVDGPQPTVAWELGDGATATGSAVTHTYGPGAFVAHATATDADGAATAATVTLWVTPENLPAAVSASADPMTGKAPLTVAFMATTEDPDGPAPLVSWSFGEGPPTVGAVAWHTYNTAGSYEVSALVVDSAGAETTATLTIGVGPANQPPSLTIDVAPSAGVAPLTVSLSATASDPDGPSPEVHWDLGDGATAAGTTAVHTFANAGSYSVVATATDVDGGANVATATITVDAPGPVGLLEIEAAPTAGAAPLVVTLSVELASASAETPSIGWDFGDGETAGGSPGSPVTHVFGAPGSYTVQASATWPGGEVTTTTTDILVQSPELDPGFLPTRLAYAADGALWVTDARANTVLRFVGKNPVARLGGFLRPLGIAIGPDDLVYVGEDGKDRIAVVDANGAPVKALGTGALKMPNDLVFSAGGVLYVADSTSNVVRAYDPTGAPAGSIGGSGEPDGALQFPSAVAVAYPAGVGELYVADQGNGRVQVFALADHSFLRSFGIPVVMMSTEWKGRFARLQSIAVSEGGHLHALDCYLNQVQVLQAKDGAFVTAHGSFGALPGELNLPLDLVVAPDGKVVVANAGNHRVEALYEVTK